MKALHDRLLHVTTLHSLFWLVLGNVAGVLLAVLLLVPAWGGFLGPFSYGRWMPVHLNAGLYGWCSLPLVGLLFRLYGTGDGFGVMGRLALRVWTGVLLFACATWLCGVTSGKLFMEWAGPARYLFPINLAILWVILAAGHYQRLRNQRDARSVLAAKTGLLLILAAVPLLLYWAAAPEIYPPINPDSGGATGGSLLGSTLGVVAIIVAAPLIIGLRPASFRTAGVVGLILTIHFVVFALLDHGHRSHHERTQIVALFSLLPWWPLLVWHLRQFSWPDGSRRWLYALCAWGGVLLVTALFTFLPGVLERWKFTNALVSHSHLAMAGMLTCFNMIVLNTMSGLRALDRPRPFWMWQIACAVHVLVLLRLGVLEAKAPALLFRGDTVVDVLYAVRLLAGLAMLAASADWLVSARRERT